MLAGSCAIAMIRSCRDISILTWVVPRKEGMEYHVANVKEHWEKVCCMLDMGILQHVRAQAVDEQTVPSQDRSHSDKQLHKDHILPYISPIPQIRVQNMDFGSPLHWCSDVKQTSSKITVSAMKKDRFFRKGIWWRQPRGNPTLLKASKALGTKIFQRLQGAASIKGAEVAKLPKVILP